MRKTECEGERRRRDTGHLKALSAIDVSAHNHFATSFDPKGLGGYRCATHPNHGLVQRRNELLRQLDQTGWRWNRDLSLELEQVDEALTRLGEFNGGFF